MNIKKIFQIGIMLFCAAMTVSAEADTPLRLMLDWALNPDHAPLFVASHYGFFAREGVSVILIPPSDAGDIPKFVSSGKVDLGIAYEPQWIMQQCHGFPLVWVATLVGQPLTVLITNTKIKQLSDLRGQPIAYSMSGTNETILKTFLQHGQLTKDSVQLVNVHYNILQALVAGRVMAVSGAMRNVEPQVLQEKHFPYHLFYPEDYDVPSFAELIIVTRTGFAHDPRIPHFVHALEQATVFLKQHPEETWQAFAKENPGLNDAVNHKIWLVSARYFDRNPGYFNQAQYEQLKKYFQACKK